MSPDRSLPSAAALAGVLDDLMELTVAPSWSRLGYATRRRLHHWDADPPARLDGRTVVLTGFTSGIGLAAAGQLAELGADLHLVARNEEKVRDRSAALRARGAKVTTSVADLSDLDAVRAVASEVADTHDRIHVLAHNAGALLHEWTPSPQGIETTVATHVLGPHLLTTLLMPALEAAGPGARVLTMSSGGMYAEKLSVDELEMTPGDYQGARAYARAKRAQVELVPEWRRRHPAVAFHALHPGWVDTPGVVSGLPRFHALTRPALRDPDEGADTLVWLAAASRDELGTSGGFWLDRRRRPTDKVPWTRTDPAERATLWDWCRRRTGIADAG